MQSGIAKFAYAHPELIWVFKDSVEVCMEAFQDFFQSLDAFPQAPKPV